MDSIRCDNCSLLNFATSSVCKRCGSPLGSAEGEQHQFQQFASSENYSGQADSTSSSEFTGQYPRYFEHSPAPHDSHQRKSTKLVIIALICLVAVIGVPWYLKYANKTEFADMVWREFKPKDGSFSILMPAEPKCTSTSVITQQETKYTSMCTYDTEGGTGFAVGYAQYPPVSPNTPVGFLFDEAINGMSASGEMTILSRKELMLDGHQVVEIEVIPSSSENKHGDRGMFRIYWAPPRMYIFGIGGPDSTDAAAARRKYLDSFKIIESR
jgi:hypothetical protein